MKKITLLILLLSSIHISFAQETYHYKSSNNKKILMNLADSSEIILTKEFKNRHIISSNKHEYVLSRRKSVWHISEQAANDTIGAIQYKNGVKLLVNGETFNQEKSRNELIYFKNGQEVLKIKMEKRSGDKFISVQENESSPLLKLIALREAALKLEADAKAPILIGAMAAAAILRVLSYSGE